MKERCRKIDFLLSSFFLPRVSWFSSGYVLVVVVLVSILPVVVVVGTRLKSYLICTIKELGWTVKVK